MSRNPEGFVVLFSNPGMTIVVASASLLLAPLVTRADVVFPPEGFFSGQTEGWEGAGPTVVLNGGPTGNGDAYLEIVATETGRQGSRASTYNASPFWTDNVPASVGFNFDMVNFPVSTGELEMRLVLFGPESTGNRWTTTEAIIVPNDGIWRPYSFTLDEEDFTRVSGSGTFDEMIQDVQRIMLRHDADGPSSSGTPVSATIGLDNLSLDFGPCYFGFCDVNGDGTCDVADIDSLMESAGEGQLIPNADFNNDGTINDHDRDAWLANAAFNAGFLEPYLVGDSNLDGSVNAVDLNALALNWQSTNHKWSGGNFTGGNVNAADLNALALNWQAAIPIAAVHTVPEPNGSWLGLLGMAAFATLFRQSNKCRRMVADQHG